MRHRTFILFLTVLTVAFLWSCEQEIIAPSDAEVNLRHHNPNHNPGGGNNGGGGSAQDTFCVNVTQDLTGCQAAINDESQAQDQIIVSESSGPGNSSMTLTFGFANTCSFTGPFSGPLVINNDGSFEFYFKDGNNKYALLADAATTTGTWPDVTFTYTSGEIVKDGKHVKQCLGPVTFSATIQITTISTFAECDAICP